MLPLLLYFYAAVQPVTIRSCDLATGACSLLGAGSKAFRFKSPASKEKPTGSRRKSAKVWVRFVKSFKTGTDARTDLSCESNRTPTGPLQWRVRGQSKNVEEKLRSASQGTRCPSNSVIDLLSSDAERRRVNTLLGGPRAAEADANDDLGVLWPENSKRSRR